MTETDPDAGKPGEASIRQWLEKAGRAHYLCGDCHGIHLSQMQEREEVLDCRLFVEPEGILLSTEVELRPASLLLVQAELSRLNMAWPAIKVFVDLVDDTLPRLVICQFLLTGAGVDERQFGHFVDTGLQATDNLVDECRDCGWLSQSMQTVPETGNNHLH